MNMLIPGFQISFTKLCTLKMEALDTTVPPVMQFLSNDAGSYLRTICTIIWLEQEAICECISLPSIFSADFRCGEKSCTDRWSRNSDSCAAGKLPNFFIEVS